MSFWASPNVTLKLNPSKYSGEINGNLPTTKPCRILIGDITKFRNGAKIDAPKEFLGKRVYVVARELLFSAHSL